MTEKRFFELFKGVAAPDYRGAPYPAFAPDKINESMFAYNLRCKSYHFDFRHGREGGSDELTVRWTSQGWDETDTFVREVRRCLMHIGFVGRVKILMNRRSCGVYTECGARRRFVLREGAKDMKKDRKTTSAIKVMADLCGIPRKKFAKEVKALRKNKRNIWVAKAEMCGYYLFRSHNEPYAMRLGNIDSLLSGKELVYAQTRAALMKDSVVKMYNDGDYLGGKLKPVRITVEIKEG